jgi:F-type H+-transporting ATPase subunit delta
MSKANNHAAESSVDVRSQQVAHVYSEALYNAAQKQGKAEALLEQLQSLVSELFAAEPLLEKFLASGAIRRDVKRATIDRAFGGKADPLLVDFLQVLNSHGRLGLVRAAALAYRDIHDQRSRRVRVKVRAAAPLSSAQQDRLKAELRDNYQLEPILDVRVDPDLLGGMLVQVGDRLFDSTVRTRLERLRNQLMAGANYVQDRRDQFSTAR